MEVEDKREHQEGKAPLKEEEKKSEKERRTPNPHLEEEENEYQGENL